MKSLHSPHTLRSAAPPFLLAPTQQRAHLLGATQLTRFHEVAAQCNIFLDSLRIYLPNIQTCLIGSAIGYVTDSLPMNDIDLHIFADGATLNQCADAFCAVQGSLLDVRHSLRCPETGNSVLFIGAGGIDVCFELASQPVNMLLYLTETGVLGIPLEANEPTIICRYPSPHTTATLLAKLAAGEFCVVEPESRFRLLFRLSLAYSKNQIILEKRLVEEAARNEVSSYTTQAFSAALSAHKRHFQNKPERFLPSILYIIDVLQHSDALPHFALALLPHLPETAKALLAGKAAAICQTQQGASFYLPALAQLPDPALRAELRLAGELDFIRQHPAFFSQLENLPNFTHTAKSAALGKELLPSDAWKRRQLLAEVNSVLCSNKQALLSLLQRILDAEKTGLLKTSHRPRYIKAIAQQAEHLFAPDLHKEPFFHPPEVLITFFAPHENLPKSLSLLLRAAPLANFRHILPADFSERTQAYYSSLACGRNLASHRLTATSLLESLYPEVPKIVLVSSKYWLSKNPEADKASFYPLYLTLLASTDGPSLLLYAAPYIKNLPVTDAERALISDDLLNQRLGLQPEAPQPPSPEKPAFDYSKLPSVPIVKTPRKRRQQTTNADSEFLQAFLKEERLQRPGQHRHRLSFFQKLFAISLIFRIVYECLPKTNFPRSLNAACQEDSKLRCLTELNTYVSKCEKPLVCYANTQVLTAQIMQAASKEEALWPALDTYAAHLSNEILSSSQLDYTPPIYSPGSNSTDNRISKLFFRINRPAVAYAMRHLHDAMGHLLPGHYFNEPDEAKKLLTQLQNLSGSCDRLMPYDSGIELQTFFEEKLVPRFTSSIMLSALPHPNKLKVLDSLVHWLAQRSIYALTAAGAAKADPNCGTLADGIWNVLEPFEARMQHHGSYSLFPKIREFLEAHKTQSNTLLEKLTTLYSDRRRHYEALQKTRGSFQHTLDRISEFAKILGAKQQQIAISRLHEWEDLVAELNEP